PRMAQRSRVSDAYLARPAKPADHGVPAACGRRTSAAVRRAHAAVGVRPALSEPPVVPRHRRYADRRGAHLRLRDSRAQASVGRRPRRLALFADLANRHGFGEARLLPRGRGWRSSRPRTRHFAPQLTPSRWRSPMDLRKRFLVKPGHKFKLAHIDPDFHGSHMSEQDAKQALERCNAKLTAMQRLF